MKRSVHTYIFAIALLASASLLLLIWSAPVVDAAQVRAVLTLSVIGVAMHLMGHTLSHNRAGGIDGSVAFVPYLASAAISPNWLTAVGVIAVSIIVQLVRRRPFSRCAFNISQHGLSISLAILVYRLSGGRSVLAVGALPYVALGALFLTFSATNSLSVSGVVALSEARRYWDVWTENNLGTLAYDFIALPMIAAFAWVYVQYGSPGVCVVAVSLLGLRELYSVNLQLERANQELLELMVAAIEARDPYTSGHSRRVSEHAKVIAQIVGLRSSVAKRVEIAALLHDVGKIHEVFAPILLKPGRLTEEENAVMQTHPIKSEELVSKVSQLRDIVPAVRHHHENWDGTGYPNGLAGDRIPLASRIIMFADTIDAMTSDRPYRKALDAAAVRSELMKHRGRQFDPTICDALLSSGRFDELFKHSPHQSLPHTQEVPKLRLASQA
ncbi:MAG: HD-GYP domain-containing protein [Gemmatimonadota bacterium]|nr:HD-GYP domain-containing protein [Gemmatimonadota bacterium]